MSFLMRRRTYQAKQGCTCIFGAEHASCLVGAAQEQFQDAKVTVFKKRRRKNSRRKMGHRQACASRPGCHACLHATAYAALLKRFEYL